MGSFLCKTTTAPNKIAYIGRSHHALNAGIESAANGSAAKSSPTLMIYARRRYAGNAIKVAHEPKSIPASAEKNDSPIAHGTAISARRFAGSATSESRPF